ncbi:MAG: HD domain-containing protein [Deltaproteobacteria bacterium]|nr:HD domain-containing protein [Deltaproteobacteria bacterium]
MTNANNASGDPTPDDLDELDLPPLPAVVFTLLKQENASPRLIAHLTLVHAVALLLVRRLKRAWPTLAFDAEAVAFGAASHDVGKARFPQELSEPGVKHEVAGRALLLEHGTPERLARFAETHGQRSAEPVSIEDLLVIAADTVWKGKRSKELDDQLVKAIVDLTRAPPWDVFMRLDGILGALAGAADDRLSWQARFSCEARQVR